jgi:hypothetical protein
MENWLNVGVAGTAMWPTTETKVQFGGHTLLLRPATRETSQSIHIDLSNISDEDALTLVNQFLSVLSWCDDQPMENKYGWSGNPVPVSVPVGSRQIGSSIAFPFYRDLEVEPKARLALALFREARTINSVPLSFLSYFKILNIFWEDKFRTTNGVRANPIVEGIRATLPTIQDSPAKERIANLQATHIDVAAYLFESCRCAVAHANTSPIADPDNIQDLHRLSADISIVKAIAEELITTQFGLSRSIIG